MKIIKWTLIVFNIIVISLIAYLDLYYKYKSYMFKSHRPPFKIKGDKKILKDISIDISLCGGRATSYDIEKKIHRFRDKDCQSRRLYDNGILYDIEDAYLAIVQNYKWTNNRHYTNTAIVTYKFDINYKNKSHGVLVSETESSPKYKTIRYCDPRKYNKLEFSFINENIKVLYSINGKDNVKLQLNPKDKNNLNLAVIDCFDESFY